MQDKQSQTHVVSKRQTTYQSLASCGAVVIAFIGFTHEVAGDIIFPWGPSFLGGPIGWHASGLLAITTGLFLLAGTLRLVHFPVVPVSLLAAAAGVFFLVVAAARYGDFHVFALAGVFAGIATAYFHHAASPGT